LMRPLQRVGCRHAAGDFFLAIDIRRSTLRPPRPLPRTVTVVSAQDLQYIRMAAEALPSPITISWPCGAAGDRSFKHAQQQGLSCAAGCDRIDHRPGQAAFCPISKLDIFSSALTIAEWSHALPP
jgi:hypothetical protein